MNTRMYHTVSGNCTRGFTLVEVVIAGALMSAMFLLSTQSLFHGKRSASLDQTASGVVMDLREQQIRAMQGTVPSPGSVVDYSARFESDRYILYPGSVYDSTNTQNKVMLLDPSMQFTGITFPGNTVTFARGSGVVRGYIPGSNTVVLTETGLGKASTLEINEAGVIFVR